MTTAQAGPVERALEDAERDVVAAVLYGGAPRLPDVARTLRPEDFGNPRFRTVWEAVLRLDARGNATDAASVAVELARRDDHAVRIDRNDLVALADECALPAALPTYVRHVHEASARRRLRTVATMLQQAESLSDPDQAMEHARRAAQLLEDATRPQQAARQLVTTDLVAFLDEIEPETAPVIAGLVERGERVIVTGGEGMGKSTLLRQIAVQVASGLHPFTLDTIDALPVLLLDLENPRRHLRRELRKLRLAARDAYSGGRLIVESRAQGLDLLDSGDRDWLTALVAATQPALIVIGPLYKLASGDPTEEKTARTVAQALDDVRIASDAAILIEAHTPHASNGQRNRPLRPYGASLWLRWPEFGVNLGDDGAIRHWRGARDERDWPTALKRGGAWPWTVDDRSPADVAATELDDDQRKCLAVITAKNGQQVQTSAIAEATELHRSRVSKACNALAERIPALVEKFELGPGKPAYYAVPEGV